jgi:hypothetical protein
MASYASYKKVKADSIAAGAVTSGKLQHGAGNAYGVKWI